MSWSIKQLKTWCLASSEQASSENKRKRTSRTDVTVFYNLISEVIFSTFLPYHLLGAIHYPQHTLKGNKFQNDMNTRRWR